MALLYHLEYFYPACQSYKKIRRVVSELNQAQSQSLVKMLPPANCKMLLHKRGGGIKWVGESSQVVSLAFEQGAT